MAPSSKPLQKVPGGSASSASKKRARTAKDNGDDADNESDFEEPKPKRAATRPGPVPSNSGQSAKLVPATVKGIPISCP